MGRPGVGEISRGASGPVVRIGHLPPHEELGSRVSPRLCPSAPTSTLVFGSERSPAALWLLSRRSGLLVVEWLGLRVFFSFLPKLEPGAFVSQRRKI